MRILHVTHQYRPAVGGAEQYIAGLSEGLAGRGHQIDVFASRSADYRTWRNQLPRFAQLEGVNVYRFSSLPRTQLTWRILAYGLNRYWRLGARWYEPLIFYGNGPICPAMFTTILRNARRYNLVHINNLHYSHALIAYIAARLRQLPIVITPHVHTKQRETHDIGYLWTILQGSDAVLTDTGAEKEYLAERLWNVEIVVGGNALSLDRFPPLDQRQSRKRLGCPEEGFIVLFLGRKTDYKGLDKCLEAFAVLRQRRRDIYLLAVGPETDFSQALWLRYAGLDGLIVYDSVSDEERLAALAACDVLAMPSCGEAFGVVYLEAWAYRKPVIGARIASVSSIIDEGGNGFLVAHNQVAQLISRLTYLADDPEAAQMMGAQGRAKLEARYTRDRLVDIVEGTYARVVRRHRTISRI
jgi:glycosyltransferase involved in cell wall biosynthesis